MSYPLLLSVSIAVLFCLLLAISPLFREFENQVKKTTLALIAIFGIITGMIGIGIVGVKTNQAGTAALCLCIVLALMYIADCIRPRICKYLRA